MAKEKSGFNIWSLLYLIIAISTARIGMYVHGSLFWAITDFFFWPWVWLKWLLMEQVNVSIIKAAFALFLS